ncbi:unnamed protein product [Lactuca virosa]|uniref:Uncharacterized protein n=1 Tax=Lactuca virosa TaxID=75947 RepID=A0AAU9PIF2_9ASTR|nr:unnamed protein product [Lactuca virosa]
MAPRAFLLPTLAFAVVLLITSEVAAATELAENTDSEYKAGGHGEHIIGRGIGSHDKPGTLPSSATSTSSKKLLKIANFIARSLVQET